MQGEIKVLLVDDEQGVHDATRLVLGRLEFEGRKVRLFHASSDGEARRVFAEHPDVAVAIVDVVMETEHAGLDFVRHVRDVLKNKICRIILRTGQPGSAPEREVVRHLEIDDYKEKTELTADRLFTAVFTALRAYRALLALQRTTRGLDTILDAAGDLSGRRGLLDFMRGMLEQLVALVSLEADGLIVRGAVAAHVDGPRYSVVVGTGAFAGCESDPVEQLLPPEALANAGSTDVNTRLVMLDSGVALIIAPRKTERYVIWLPLSAPISSESSALLRLFAEKLAVSLDNALLQHENTAAQEEILSRLCDVVEYRSNETGQHVRRMSRYARLMANLLGLDNERVETIAAAAPLHDIGKISIPDSILKKPGKLDPREMEMMRQHPSLGHAILSGSRFSVLREGAAIALSHHERWDGGGYPSGLAGEAIPLSGRIVATVDIFDALMSARVYKPAYQPSETLAMMRSLSGSHLDPRLVEVLETNFSSFVDIFLALQEPALKNARFAT